MQDKKYAYTIGLDTRMLGEEQTGIGKYIARIAEYVPMLMPEVKFVIFLNEPEFSRFIPASPNVVKRLVNAHWYGYREQLTLPLAFLRSRPNLMHFPHFNVPVLYPGKFVVTIHDITPYFFPGHKMGSWIRRAGFWLTFSSAVRKAHRIIAVSRHTKKDIVKHFRTPEQNITVIYEGIDDIFKKAADEETTQRILTRYRVHKPFMLYVGVWREHKNLVGLLHAYARAHRTHRRFPDLVLTGKENPQYGEVRAHLNRLRLQTCVKTPGFVPQPDLVHFYNAAELTVVPSFYEGFGLTGLESLSCGTPVAASRLTSLPEILGEAAFYFDPYDVENMAAVLQDALSNKAARQERLKNAKEVIERYRWDTMANETAACYKKALGKG